MKKETRGGSRPGAGRKPTGTNWKTVSFRIQEQWREPVKIAVRREIARLKDVATTLTT